MKTIGVRTLLNTLGALDAQDAFQVVVNQVGNLAILDAHGEYVGYIDFRTGKAEMGWETDDDETQGVLAVR